MLLNLWFALFTLTAFSQTSEHLSLKSVPVDGTLDQFVSRMKQNGFTLLVAENGFATLKGDFAGYKECVVSVSTLDKKDLVYKTGVAFPGKSTWSDLSGNYFELKSMLTQKYGEPPVVYEKFQSTSEPDDDLSKMSQVSQNNCKYYAIWITDKGTIQLLIDHRSLEKFVKLVYLDKVNGDVIKAKAIDDL